MNTAINQNPTIGAFGHKDNIFSAEWIYSTQNLETYKFSSPNPVPGPAPDISNGKKWIIDEGIGAGPILVKGGL